MIGTYISPKGNIVPQNYSDGHKLIKAMHKKYNGKWFEKLYIHQNVTHYKDGIPERNEIWKEFIVLPGKVRSNIGDAENGNYEISKNDSQFVFRKNKLVLKRKTVHTILLLGFDVYKQNPEKTFEQLKESDFNLEKNYETSWQNRPTHVVGVSKRDTKTNQFWIDKEHLYLVRLIQKTHNGKFLEIELNNLKKLDNGWIATELIFKLDGDLKFKEDYLEYKISKNIDPEYFNIEN
jgi:hypothetical protein